MEKAGRIWIKRKGRQSAGSGEADREGIRAFTRRRQRRFGDPVESEHYAVRSRWKVVVRVGNRARQDRETWGAVEGSEWRGGTYLELSCGNEDVRSVGVELLFCALLIVTLACKKRRRVSSSIILIVTSFQR